MSQPSATDTMARLAGSAAEGVLGVNQMLPIDVIKDQANVSAVLKRYAAEHRGKTPDPAFLYGYNFTMVFIEAARRAGPHLTTRSLVAALETLKNYDLHFGMAPATFSPTQHVGTFSTNLLKVVDGKWAFVVVLN